VAGYDLWQEIWYNHRGAFLGAIIAFVVGVLILTIGFWRTLLLVILVLLGFFIGSQLDERSALRSLWQRFFKE